MFDGMEEIKTIYVTSVVAGYSDILFPLSHTWS